MKERGNLMPSEWRVSSQYLGDEKVFRVFRLKDAAAVDHGGNREYAEGIFYSLEQALDVAARLNGWEDMS